MTIDQFIKKWSPADEDHLISFFKEDLWNLLANLKSEPFKATAVEVLSSIDDTELIVDTEGEYGRIIWGKKGEAEETGTMIVFARAFGHTEDDWRVLLKCIVGQTLNKSK